MDQQFDHPGGTRLLSGVRSIFETKPVFQKRDRPVIFLCGGPVAPRTKANMRRQFLRWSARELPKIVNLLAEDAFRHTKLYDPPETVNLADFEKMIGDIADCVLLFPESEGSFAELGFFSQVDKIRDKILVANAITYQAKDSFLNLGPIKTIDGFSYLSPAVHITKSRGRFDFTPLQDRLERLRTHRKSFPYLPYSKLDHLGKFLITLEMINIFQIVTLESLADCVRSAFNTASPNELKRVLSILVGAGYVEVRDRFFCLPRSKESLLEFEDVRVDDLKARVLNYYQQRRPDIYRRIRRSSRC